MYNPRKQRHPGRPSRRRDHLFHEEWAYVLDFLPQGNPLDRHPQHRTRALAQVIGDMYFTLLEVYPKPDQYLVIGEKVYIGHGLRDKVAQIFGRISYEDLTTVARDNLSQIVYRLVLEKEPVFVKFFNIAEPVTLKLHSLELLPGIGKKSMRVILEERRKKPFESFKDIEERTRISDPAKIIADRIILELQGNEKYYLFVKPYVSDDKGHIIFLGYLIRIYRELGLIG